MRAVEVYRCTPWGLYMARPTPGRAQFHYLESWLLPSLGLRANVFHFNPGYERQQDYYLDIGAYHGRSTPPGTPRTTTSTWWSTTGDRTDLIDVDELFAAHRHGLVSTETAEAAIQRAVAAVAGAGRHGHDLSAWLAGQGMDLTWR